MRSCPASTFRCDVILLLQLDERSMDLSEMTMWAVARLAQKASSTCREKAATVRIQETNGSLDISHFDKRRPDQAVGNLVFSYRISAKI